MMIKCLGEKLQRNVGVKTFSDSAGVHIHESDECAFVVPRWSSATVRVATVRPVVLLSSGMHTVAATSLLRSFFPDLCKSI